MRADLLIRGARHALVCDDASPVVDDASIAIADGRVIAGSMGAAGLALVRRWTAVHRDELSANWERAAAHRPMSPIEPLR